MRTSDPPELEFQVVELPRQYWEPNLAPLWEQPVLLTPGPSLQSPQMPVVVYILGEIWTERRPINRKGKNLIHKELITQVLENSELPEEIYHCINLPGIEGGTGWRPRETDWLTK